MELSVSQISRVFRTYQNQERIAELNRQHNIRTVQRQVDTVSISDQARQLLTEQIQQGPFRRFVSVTLPEEPEPVAPEPVETAVEPAVESEEFTPTHFATEEISTETPEEEPATETPLE